MWMCGSRGKDNTETGIVEEIGLENCYRNPTKNYFIWDTVLYDFARREKNLTLLLNCTCMDAETEQGEFANGRTIRIRRVTGYQLTTQTFWDVEAKLYADCSGDSILAPLTGAEFRQGREAAAEFGELSTTVEQDDRTMGMSCLIQGRQTEREIKFTPPEWSLKIDKEMIRGDGDRYPTHQNYWYLELGGEQDTIHDTEKITEQLIPLAVGTWDYVKNSGEFDTKNWELEFLGFLPGKRESRRLMGEYMVTQLDISADRQYPDTVAYGGWPLDDHYPGGFFHRGAPNTNYETPGPYPLPYRALYSRNVENLYFAGRNISVTHMALSSVRVMKPCGLFGQAIGTAAAIAVQKNLTPHGVYENALEELQQRLMEDDSFLPGFTRKIAPECKTAVLTGGSDALRDGQDRPNRIYKTETCGDIVQNGAKICYELQNPTQVEGIHLVFDSDLNRETLPGDSYERRLFTRANVLLDSPQTYLPKTLCAEFELWAETENGEEILLKKVTENRLRAHDVLVGQKLKKIWLVIQKTWGETEQTNLFSFDFR